MLFFLLLVFLPIAIIDNHPNSVPIVVSDNPLPLDDFEDCVRQCDPACFAFVQRINPLLPTISTPTNLAFARVELIRTVICQRAKYRNSIVISLLLTSRQFDNLRILY